MTLGFGMIAYRSTLGSLAIFFAFMSVLMYPVLKIYQEGTAIDVAQVDTKYGMYSIANLGYSSIQCNSVPLNMEQMILTCPFGNITEIVKDGQAFGITPADSVVLDACVRNHELYNNQECSEKLNEDKITQHF